MKEVWGQQVLGCRWTEEAVSQPVAGPLSTSLLTSLHISKHTLFSFLMFLNAWCDGFV